MDRKRVVLVAVDSKIHARNAFDWYLENLYRPNDEVIVFHCAQWNLHIGMPGPMVNVEQIQHMVEKGNQEAKTVIKHYTDILKDKEIRFKAILEHNSKPGDAIIKYVEDHHVDQIVMGTRDLGPVKRTLIGSVSSSVVRHSKVPVTIVKIPGHH